MASSMAPGKYILIISQASEKSTDDVMRYLHYADAPFVRINDTDVAQGVDITLGKQDSIRLTFSNNTIDLKDIACVWYRRGRINLATNRSDVKLTADELATYQQYYEFYLHELNTVYDYLYQQLSSVKHINNYQDNKITKLNQLAVAKRNGLPIPETTITNSLSTIDAAAGKQTQILKALSFPIFTVKAQNGTTRYSSNTSVLLSPADAPAHIAKYAARKPLLTLLQGYIDKKFEIRTFFLYGKFFSMAIFSQDNEKTKIDFRNYDYEKPNRNVPFQLPADIEQKITGFMRDMNLSSGSLDIIYTHNKEYIFLEVNPIGQFDWLSKECNYFIEKHISNELIDGLKQAV